MKSMMQDILTVYGGSKGLKPSEVEAMLDGETYIHDQKKIQQMSKRLYPYLNMSIYEPDEMIGLFLRSGLIGKIVRPVHTWRENGKEGMYLITIFEYQQQGYLNFNEITEFGIHPILSDAIGLKETEGNKAVIYPYPEPDELPNCDINKYHGRLV